MLEPLTVFGSVAQLCAMLWDSMDWGMPGFSVHHQLLELAQTHFHRVSDAVHLFLCHHLLLLPSICPKIRFFSSQWALCIRWSKYWRFSFRISHSKIYSGLNSFMIDWFDLLAVQGNLKSLFQHHSSRASILQLFLRSKTHIHTWLLEKP